MHICMHKNCSQQTAIINPGPLPTVIFFPQNLLWIILLVLNHMSVIMMETHTEHSADKKSSNRMSTVKPMRAAACEQSSLQICHFLCGCWYSCNDLPLKCQQEPQFFNFSSYLKSSSWILMLVVVFTCKAVFKKSKGK